MNDTEIIIKQPKKEWFIGAALIFAFAVFFLYFLLYDGSYFYIIFSLLILVLLIVIALVVCSTKYVFDESGVRRMDDRPMQRL